MIILALRTDKPEAEIGLYEDMTQLAYVTWQAHRQLAETLHIQIAQLLKSQGKSLQDIQGIACYQGPGSFTGLRIGLSVANALAYSLAVPIVAETAESWRETAIGRLLEGKADTIVLPEYGAPVHITLPRR